MIGRRSPRATAFDSAARAASNTEQPTGADGARCLADQSAGPYDSRDYGDLGELLDAGSLWLPLAAGPALHFSMDQASQAVLAAVYMHGESAMQLQAYAAPKSGILWDKVRLDLRTAIANSGGNSVDAEGEFGTELQANVPVGQGAQVQLAPQRFVGVDGNRWLLKATITGTAAQDITAAAPLFEILRRVVVNRGNAPYPPRELLPLHLPQQAPGHLSGGSASC